MLKLIIKMHLKLFKIESLFEQLYEGAIQHLGIVPVTNFYLYYLQQDLLYMLKFIELIHFIIKYIFVKFCYIFQ